MEEMISVNTLPESLRRRFPSGRVRIHEDGNGKVTLTPVPKPTKLWGLLPKGLLTTEDYFAQKRLDKELEQRQDEALGL
jgi:virulence-associated protein VagC